MNYKTTYEAIDNWAGIATQYWIAVNILKERHLLTDIEIAQVDEGLTTANAALINFKMNALKEVCLGSENEVYDISADETTPDVSHGTATYRLPENTVANEITGLDNAVIGTRLVLEWLSTTNHSTITNGSTFIIEGSFTPVTGAKLILEVKSANTFEELYRHIP